MKKLISQEDIKKALQHKKSTIIIDDDTIITPSARDAAKEYKIQFKKETECSYKDKEDVCKSEDKEVDIDIIYRIVKEVLEET